MILNRIFLGVLVSAFLVIQNSNSSAGIKPKSTLEDRNLWVSAKIIAPIYGDLDLELSEELRYYKERKILEQTLSDIGLSYELYDWLKAGISYRYKSYSDEDDPDKDDFAQEINTSFTGKITYYNIKLQNKLRLQSRFKKIGDDEFILRDKVTASYSGIVGWLEPYTSAEIFQQIAAGSDNFIKKARFAVGLTFIPIKMHEISIFYLRENEYNKKNIVNSNIIGFAYQLKL